MKDNWKIQLATVLISLMAMAIIGLFCISVNAKQQSKRNAEYIQQNNAQSIETKK